MIQCCRINNQDPRNLAMKLQRNARCKGLLCKTWTLHCESRGMEKSVGDTVQQLVGVVKGEAPDANAPIFSICDARKSMGT